MPPVLQTSPAIEKQLHPARASARILFALTDTERQLFFPDNQQPLLQQSAWMSGHKMAPEVWDACLAEHRPQVLVTSWTTPMLPMQHSTLDGGSVDYVCHVTGSVRPVVSREMIVRGLRVTNWGGLIAPQVAEHALLLILAALRDLGRWQDFILKAAEGPKPPHLPTRTLRGKRVALHGFGGIVRELIKLLQPFGVELSAFSTGVSADHIHRNGARPAVSLVALAADADVFVECEALTDATRQSVGAEVVSALPDGAAFINVGRGAVVDEIALAAAARARGIRVACDVFVQEHLSSASPLFGLPGAIYSPHIGGPALDAYGACGAHALRNISRYLNGHSPEGIISTEIFDRST